LYQKRDEEEDYENHKLMVSCSPLL
jgi:hypothetical protein